MNERIRELAKQACAFADIQYNKQTRATFYTNKSVEEFFREKFAELIVIECAKVVGDMADPEDSERYFWAIQNASQKIKQHFGVEL